MKLGGCPGRGVMKRSFVAFVAMAGFAGCNQTSNVGVNTGGSGGGMSNTTATGGVTATTDTSTSGTSAVTTTGMTSASATGSTTSSTASGGPPIQGAHVYIGLRQMLGNTTTASELNIVATASADPTQLSTYDASPCHVHPNGPAQPSQPAIAMPGAVATATVPGLGSFPIVLDPSKLSLRAHLSNNPLPDGTLIHVAFDPSSSILAGQTFDLPAISVPLTQPPQQTPPAMTYHKGTDWNIQWPNVQHQYELNMFVFNSSTMAIDQVGSCGGPGPSSGVLVPVTVMNQLVTELQNAPPQSDFVFDLELASILLSEQAAGGDFASTFSTYSDNDTKVVVTN